MPFYQVKENTTTNCDGISDQLHFSLQMTGMFKMDLNDI